jgi:hypothetical protein
MLQKLLEGCWAADAEKRPDWEEIIFILNELIVDSCSFNAKVRTFWKNNFFYNNDDYVIFTTDYSSLVFGNKSSLEKICHNMESKSWN